MKKKITLICCWILYILSVVWLLFPVSYTFLDWELWVIIMCTAIVGAGAIFGIMWNS